MDWGWAGAGAGRSGCGKVSIISITTLDRTIYKAKQLTRPIDSLGKGDDPGLNLLLLGPPAPDTPTDCDSDYERSAWALSDISAKTMGWEIDWKKWILCGLWLPRGVCPGPGVPRPRARSRVIPIHTCEGSLGHLL